MLRNHVAGSETSRRLWYHIELLENVRSSLKQQAVWSAAVEGRLEEFERLCLCEIRAQALRDAVLAYLEHVKK